MRGGALGGAVALAAALGVWSGPGAAPAAAYVCSFGIDSPTSATPSGTASISFRGPFAARQGQGERVLGVTFTSAPGPIPPSVTRVGSAVGPANRYDVPVGGLSLNGRYAARVVARHEGTGLFNCDDGLGRDRRDTERSATVTFSVSVKAKPPSNLRARFEAGPPRSVVVTWDPSPDPDTAGYELTRRIGAGPVEPLPDVPPNQTSWTDGTPPADAASVTYAIRSARNGPAPGTTSERSDVVTVGVDLPAPPPPPTTTTPPPVDPGGTGGTGGTGTGAGPLPPGGTGGAPAPPGTGGSAPSGTAPGPGPRPFVLGQAVAGSSSPGGAPPVLRFPNGLIGAAKAEAREEGGYQPLLPYPARPDGAQIELVAEDGEQAQAGGAGGASPGEERTPQLVYVAGALLSGVVAAHILWLRNQVLRPGADDDDGDGLPLEPAVEPTPDLVFQPVDPPAPRPALASRPILISRPEASP